MRLPACPAFKGTTHSPDPGAESTHLDFVPFDLSWVTWVSSGGVEQADLR
jgi:hypothetical protein